MKPKFNYLNMEKALRLFLPLLLLILNQYDLNALNPGAVTITNKSGPSNNPCNQGPVASYVAYEICNNTANQLSGLTATLGGLSTGFTLHNGQLVTQNIGTLAAGGCKMVYWYVKYPCTFNQTTNITITVADPQPGAVSATNQVKTTSNLSASAGGQLIGATLGPVPFLGGTTWIDKLQCRLYAVGGVRGRLVPNPSNHCGWRHQQALLHCPLGGRRFKPSDCGAVLFSDHLPFF
jgi:hypothetical protein